MQHVATLTTAMRRGMHDAYARDVHRLHGMEGQMSGEPAMRSAWAYIRHVGWCLDCKVHDTATAIDHPATRCGAGQRLFSEAAAASVGPPLPMVTPTPYFSALRARLGRPVR